MGLSEGYGAGIPNLEGRIFATWRQNKRADECNKWILEILKKNIRHILTKKHLGVARFRQCVPVGRQN